ncbi:ABC transporter permease [Metabacillus litoralis]|uniref:ABC transporter permease n=1 Tax=Metabacillus litoralis TaxID=152268 RepID=A0A5C6W8A5_9BACI|nr:ABC transporter permease [Metabacillus litoralis]TXC92690.1 ABC transporter permease [Metabacillus litoralis]
MNIINKLTIRHLKENKRRTLVTIIGVIISVAMITAVATLGVSFLNLMIREDISQNGEWHVNYKNVNAEQIEAIERDKATEKVMLSRDLGYAHLPNSKNLNKPYLFVKEYDPAAFEQFPIEVSEGRLPQAENEVVISEEIENNAGVKYKIGDQLTLDIGNRVGNGGEAGLDQTNGLIKNENGIAEELKITSTKTLTIVGTIKRPPWEYSWAPGYTIISYIDKSLVSNAKKANAIVMLKKVKGSIFESTKEFAEKQNIESIGYNSELLRYYGVTKNDNLRVTLFSLLGIIMIVIIVGSVALIYNAFAISVSERSRHLGMLASVGATKKQKRNSVFFEGVIIGAISIPIGLLSGIGGIAVTFSFINSYLQGALNVSEKLEVIVTPGSIMVACVVSVVTIFISTFYPAKKASKVSAIDALRQTQDIKLTGKAVKTSRFVRKLFGIEAEIGLKNLKRNKRRYQATVFSLVISIVLFLAVSFFTENIKKSLELSQGDITSDIQVYGYGSENGLKELEPLTKVDYVTESVMANEVLVNAMVDLDFASNEILELVKEDDSALIDGKYPYFASIYGLEKDSFREYATSIGVDSEKLEQSKQNSAIIIEEIKYEDAESGKVIETKTINADIGQKLDIYAINYEDTEDREFLNSVEIAALTNQAPIGIQKASLGGITIIVQQETLNKLVGSNKQTLSEMQPILFMNSSDPLGTQKVLDEMNLANVDIFNVHERRQEQEQMVLLLSVFTYGFITLISLISIANIFNTISTSISLRKREFAMLRSVGMTPKGFNKMINYESIFYGIKSLTYGLPISFIIMYLMYLGLKQTFEYGFVVPWLSVAFSIVIIFIIVGLAMFYSIQKIKKDNIIDGLKQESV